MNTGRDEWKDWRGKGEKNVGGIQILIADSPTWQNVTYVSLSLEPMVTQVMDLLKASNS